MSQPIRKAVWQDAYAVIEPQINASGVHEWNFDPSFPIDLRFFVMRRESDIRLNHHSYFELLYVHSGEVEYQVRSALIVEGRRSVCDGWRAAASNDQIRQIPNPLRHVILQAGTDSGSRFQR